MRLDSGSISDLIYSEKTYYRIPNHNKMLRNFPNTLLYSSLEKTILDKNTLEYFGMNSTSLKREGIPHS